jgi:8-oxo-dGTP diphosphatase
MPAALKSMITGLVSGLEPADDLGREHRRNALSWLAGTDDIFRRVKPLTPSPHLVSYFLLVDRPAGSVLLCDHRLSGTRQQACGISRTLCEGFSQLALRDRPA